MGTDTNCPDRPGDRKHPAIKDEGGGPNRPSSRRNTQSKKFIMKDHFQGDHPDLAGYEFETGSNHTNQIAYFTTVDTKIRALVGQQFDPLVLESIKKMKIMMPPEPVIVTEADGSISRMEEIKYGKKYDRWLTRSEKVEKELKLVYSIYYGQCNEDIKSSLAEDPTFKKANEEKDLIKMYRILQNVNFSYKSVQEPILTMWNAKRDFMNLRQQRHQSVQEYYERFIALKEVNETLNTNIHDDLGSSMQYPVRREKTPLPLQKPRRRTTWNKAGIGC